MSRLDDLKTAGIRLHLICTGAGAGVQDALWQIPGASSFLSGAAFPYAPDETDRLIGFTPDSYCSEETAIDLASQAYMRAYKFGDRKPVGLGLTASVTSDREHRGEHRVHVCVITDEKVIGTSLTLAKGGDPNPRFRDGNVCNTLALDLLLEAIYGVTTFGWDWSKAALERFFVHPYFTTEGKRLTAAPKKMVLYPGSYNPPHPGHLNVAKEVEHVTRLPVVFAVTADGPHKAPLKLQDLLKRARGLRGKNRLFTRGDALFIDKARVFQETPIAMGADALRNMLDPKWGTDIKQMLIEFAQLGTQFYVSSRPENGTILTLEDVLAASNQDADLLVELFKEIHGVWDFSSTQERSKVGA